MTKQKKTDRYIALAKELFDKKDAGKLPRGKEHGYQKKLGALWETLSKADKSIVEDWVSEYLVQQDKFPRIGIKHLIECNCSLPQYRNRPRRVFHKFAVFSVIGEDSQVEIKHVQCNNCGAVHRVVEIGKSEFTGRDESHAISTIEDVKISIPEDIRDILDDYQSDLPSWEEVAFIYENERWGSHVVLSSEESHGEMVTKILRFVAPGIVKIETLTDQVTIS